MALQRHYLDQVAISFYDKEATYNAGPAAWTDSSACTLLDFSDASAHELWDDNIQGDTDVITGKELVSVQEIARQSMRLTYEEPRVKANTLAGLLAMTLGTVTSAQDGVLIAYRHKITPASSVMQPSVGVQTKRDNGVQWLYTGVKTDSFTLNENGPYFRMQATMVGSGTRTASATAFPASVPERWLRWGDAHVYLRDVTGLSPITIPAAPSQTATNLGGGSDFSTRVLSWSLTWNNNLQPDFGYRASTGLVRGNFHPTRRAATFTMQFETDTASEAAELNHYLLQHQLAIELNINSGVLVAATGVFLYGAIIVLPRLQLTAVPRGETNQFENLSYTANVLDDGANPSIACWVYNNSPAYLA